MQFIKMNYFFRIFLKNLNKHISVMLGLPQQNFPQMQKSNFDLSNMGIKAWRSHKFIYIKKVLVIIGSIYYIGVMFIIL